MTTEAELFQILQELLGEDVRPTTEAGVFTTRTAAKCMGVSVSTMGRRLRGLRERGLIEPVNVSYKSEWGRTWPIPAWRIVERNEATEDDQSLETQRINKDGGAT